MNDTLAPEAPAITPASLGLPADDGPVTTVQPSHAAEPANGHDAGSGETADGAAGSARKTPEEVFAELDQKYLKVHKSLAPTGERRRVALDWLDEQRDRVRLALNNVRMTDAEVDARMAEYVAGALEAEKGL